MIDHRYNADWDSSEAIANFSTRHIFNIYKRKQKRDELLKQLKARTVVEMFPDRRPPPYPRIPKT